MLLPVSSYLLHPNKRQKPDECFTHPVSALLKSLRLPAFLGPPLPGALRNSSRYSLLA